MARVSVYYNVGMSDVAERKAVSPMADQVNVIADTNRPDVRIGAFESVKAHGQAGKVEYTSKAVVLTAFSSAPVSRAKLDVTVSAMRKSTCLSRPKRSVHGDEI